MVADYIKNIFKDEHAFYDHLSNICASREINAQIVRCIGEALNSERANQYYGGQTLTGVDFRVKGEEHKQLGLLLRILLKNDDGSDYTPMFFLGYTCESHPKIGFVYQADQIDCWEDYAPRT